jgi:hypothetical protein
LGSLMVCAAHAFHMELKNADGNGPTIAGELRPAVDSEQESATS